MNFLAIAAMFMLIDMDCPPYPEPGDEYVLPSNGQIDCLFAEKSSPDECVRDVECMAYMMLAFREKNGADAFAPPEEMRFEYHMMSNVVEFVSATNRYDFYKQTASASEMLAMVFNFKCFSNDIAAREYCLRAISLFQCDEEELGYSADNLVGAVLADTAEYDRTHSHASVYPVKGSNYWSIVGERRKHSREKQDVKEARRYALRVAGFFLLDVLEGLPAETRTNEIARYAGLCGIPVEEFRRLARLEQ